MRQHKRIVGNKKERERGRERERREREPRSGKDGKRHLVPNQGAGIHLVLDDNSRHAQCSHHHRQHGLKPHGSAGEHKESGELLVMEHASDHRAIGDLDDTALHQRTANGTQSKT